MEFRQLCWFACLGAAAAIAGPPPDHCTAVAVGPKASADGAPMVGQTADSEGGPGSSIIYVASADHKDGSLRPILDQETDVQIGSIPEVKHTYAYTFATGGYGLMNEHKLAFGESTCSARITAASLAHNGTALFSNKELSKIALERCKTARCAIKLMGTLAVEMGGFYGEDTGVDAGGETLVLADPTEAWVFNILADPTGKSAIWAAQRVPDDGVAFVPNTFIIRSMDLNSDDFMLSSNAKDVAKEFGWWDGKEPFSFAGSFSLGEYSNPHYSARRLWRAYNLVAPSLKLDPSLEITEMEGAYPFAVRPDQKLTAGDIFRVYRDYYEGTPYSLVSDTLAAGPYKSPLRLAAGDAEAAVPTGAWERPISIYRADYAGLSVCHPDGHGIVWFAPHTPHASVFVPAWTSGTGAPPSKKFVVDKAASVDRESLFWAVSAVSNWAFGSMFSRAIADIRRAQAEFEPMAHELAAKLASSAAHDQSMALEYFAEKAHTKWWDLFWSLMGKYNDGYVVTRDAQGAVTSTAVGYPSWWLEAVDFKHGVDAPNSSFAALKRRMANAAAKMAEIDAKRPRPHTVLPEYVL
eukprot:CAMPEP_0197902330 /NCGR_PEP_ID=MMETSP1439-20131203/53177_1 /TAXON_ID=66791 /ORGANISM="Gonyaulax spinifera, Strain CCMP409" /LENGTH=578 /DNA_ID=CAMNT_0043523345 /DNA_START=49 /DNA_END=1785 /DNA_ORIENTATION=-